MAESSELGRGFIVETFVVRRDPFTKEEICTRSIGGDKVRSRAAFERFCVDVVATVHDEDVLCATFGGNGKATGGIGMS